MTLLKILYHSHGHVVESHVNDAGGSTVYAAGSFKDFPRQNNFVQPHFLERRAQSWIGRAGRRQYRTVHNGKPVIALHPKRDSPYSFGKRGHAATGPEGKISIGSQVVIAARYFVTRLINDPAPPGCVCTSSRRSLAIGQGRLKFAILVRHFNSWLYHHHTIGRQPVFQGWRAMVLLLRNFPGVAVKTACMPLGGNGDSFLAHPGIDHFALGSFSAVTGEIEIYSGSALHTGKSVHNKRRGSRLTAHKINKSAAITCRTEDV
jgi:hypothetical protein